MVTVWIENVTHVWLILDEPDFTSFLYPSYIFFQLPWHRSFWLFSAIQFVRMNISLLYEVGLTFNCIKLLVSEFSRRIRATKLTTSLMDFQLKSAWSLLRNEIYSFWLKNCCWSSFDNKFLFVSVINLFFFMS